MCKAITKSGKVCKNKSKSDFCHIHENISQPKSIEVRDPGSLEKREEFLKFILKENVSFINPYVMHHDAVPLFQGIDLTNETLDIIERAKRVCAWTDEIYKNMYSFYLNDNLGVTSKYHLLRDMIGQNIITNPSKDPLFIIQKVDLLRDTTLLFIKVMLSVEAYDDVIKAKNYYLHVVKRREKILNDYHEGKINKLLLKDLKKYTPICDDICNYVIANYL